MEQWLVISVQIDGSKLFIPIWIWIRKRYKNIRTSSLITWQLNFHTFLLPSVLLFFSCRLDEISLNDRSREFGIFNVGYWISIINYLSTVSTRAMSWYSIASIFPHFFWWFLRIFEEFWEFVLLVHSK
jgi:hypothetical protein